MTKSARRDMENGVGYFAEENGEILAVFMFYNGRDKTYDKIYGGDLLNSRSYSVIHRIADAKQGLNIMSHCIEFCRGISDNIKIDTHKDNVPMQKALAKRGFRYCGIIHLGNGEERLAYQWQAPEKQEF